MQANRHEPHARAYLPKSDGGTYEETAILLVFQLVSSVIVGLTSIVTNLLAMVFLIGSIAGWIANAPSNLIFQTAGLGIFFAFAPHIAGWLLEKATDLTLGLLDILLI